MMLATSQSTALNKATPLKEGNIKSTGKFGDVLSQTLATTTSSSKDTSSLSAEQIEKLSSLLDFLKLDDLSKIENGEELANDVLVNGEELLQNPFLQDILGESVLEDLIASLLALNGENISKELVTGSNEEIKALLANQEENEQSAVVTQQLQDVVEKLVQELNNFTSLKEQIPSAESILKFSKIYTLLKNNLDLTDRQVEQIDALKQSLDKLVSKIDLLFNTEMKNKSSFSTLLNRQSIQEAQLQLQNMNGRLLNGGSLKQNVVATNESENTTTHNPFITMSKVEQYVLSVPTNKAPVNQEEFIKAFENLLSKAKFTNSNGIQKLFIKLNPESLGSLRIELIQKDGMMMAKIIASTKGAKELLDSQLQGLKQSFVNQNISVDKIEVSQNFTNFSQERNLQREQNQQQQRNEQHQLAEEEELKDDFLNQFQEALLEAEM
ncbi:flagellar hook-length control protein FliK [Bacillus massiliigorillae]|uniref:flagellar hook-length control protein FliK n=1 Tax=Bacillus massiliigorillae TaxID=1243664 RepID=UPI001E4AE4F1|nr:flagellar hook-length control protein FliK [Bacillus massiliigorillae]